MAASITVAVRVRPANVWEAERLPIESPNDSIFMGDGHLASSPHKIASPKSLRPIVQVMDDKVLIFDPKDPITSRAFEQKGFLPPGSKRYKDHRYTFDRVFGEDARQVDVYEDTTRPLLDGLLDGFNATVFAYGATGCGKTHTITGTDADPGIIYLTMAELFQKIEDRKDNILCEVSLSFLEIYNEEIRDLLGDSDAYVPRGGLAMRDDQSNRVTVPGLVERRPTNADEVKEMVMQGNERRTQSPTHANQTSSRSHAVLQVNVTQAPRTAGTTEERTMATLSIIDLAGSERASATTNMGQRMIEGANINKSLLALGNCINALCESGNRTRHVPYRNSKLTRLLKFSLGGNCKTVMIVCIAPASNHYDDTQNTLKYANRAKDIKTKVSRNFINVDRHVGQYVEAINRLNEEVAELKGKLAGKLGAEAEVQRRKKLEAQAELARVKADLQAKFDQTKRTLVEGAACEAQLFVANSRLKAIHGRLGCLASEAANGPLASDLLAEQVLLRSLASTDEQLLRPESAANVQLQKAGNSHSMFEATLRAVSQRKSDRLDELAAENIRADAHSHRAEMDKVRAETREGVLRAALNSQASFTTELVGLLARCTVMMADGGAMLQNVVDSSDLDPAVVSVLRDITASMSRVAQANDAAFTTLVGQSTASFQSARDSTLLKFSSHASSTRPPPSKPSSSRTIPSHRSSLGHSRRRSSTGLSIQHASPRRTHGKSPRKPASSRQSFLRAEPARRVTEKKSVRWRDETSQGEIDDRGLRSVTAPAKKGITPMVVVSKVDGKKKSLSMESDGEWEDERTDDSISFASSSITSATLEVSQKAPSASRSRSNRLNPNFLKPSRPSPMSSLGEESEDEETPRSSRGKPLADRINSPTPTSAYADLGASPTKLRPGLLRPSTPPMSSSVSRRGTVPGTASKSRRRSNIGPVRAERARRRSSLIPRPSPPAVSYAYTQPRKSPSKKNRRASVASEGGAPAYSLGLEPQRQSLRGSGDHCAPISPNPHRRMTLIVTVTLDARIQIAEVRLLSLKWHWKTYLEPIAECLLQIPISPAVEHCPPMDFTNIKDPAGVQALLDSLRSSPVFAIPEKSTVPTAAPSDELSTSPSDPMPIDSAIDGAASNPMVAAPTPVPRSSTLSSHLSSLLSRLQPLMPQSFTSGSAKPPTNSHVPGPVVDIRAGNADSVTPVPSPDLRTISFQQSLTHLGRLLEDTSIVAALRKMKQEQEDMESRLWRGREVIIEKQKEKVGVALARARIINVNPTVREIDIMSAEFDKELDKYDRERVLVAWDELVERQQESLEKLGFPAMYVTSDQAERTKQQRIIQIILNAL
ncbi:hypothetical protein BS47DRAFT_1481137 [Hydnum rufescens UP504]|uniref:Kinesin motor domain-containing protein n=1 Tax=Hydnum rufescens UP504 TaxID=1448309 RepID=A0A9P6BDD6_9AGAM|nr:hypothetical protein BS47DRAFT_1481137 [Hydnum rufescens UP504]